MDGILSTEDCYNTTQQLATTTDANTQKTIIDLTKLGEVK